MVRLKPAEVAGSFNGGNGEKWAEKCRNFVGLLGNPII